MPRERPIVRMPITLLVRSHRAKRPCASVVPSLTTLSVMMLSARWTQRKLAGYQECE